jgi:hypothetical protein
MTNDSPAARAYAEAVKMMQDDGAKATVEDVLQGLIDGVYVPRPRGMTGLLNVMLDDEDFMEGFND